MDTHRKYVGTVVSGMILKNLQSQIEELIDNPDIFFVIIDTRSRDLVTQSVKGNISKSLIDKVLSKEFSEDSNSLSYKNSYYKKLDEYPYIIGTIYNKGVVNSNAQIRFAIYLAVIFLLLSFICLIFYGFHKKLITPVFDLIKFADQIYKGDPSRKTPKFEVKEMNDLAKSLHKIDGIISNDDRLKKK
jgi:nitrate/nitrite-specific signal transduction histidine kinase